MASVRHTLLSACSALALGMIVGPAFAQDQSIQTDGSGTAASAATVDPGAASQEIIVTGVRASLSSAQSIKRNAPQIVDSIVAEDIGKLPDNTVADALQRVTGVQVIRGNGETTGVDIRGLPNAATLLNGREAFTGTGRGVALQDIPAELLAGVDVYKTSTPDIIEGGVAGVIDIRLHRPFDFKGFTIAGDGRAVYSDQAKKWSYLGGGLVSDRWDTGIGELGLLIGASYNKRRYEDQVAFDFDASGTPVATPDTVGGTYTDGNRRRIGLNASAQWRPSDKLEFYADGTYTQYKERYGVNFFIGLPKAGNVVSITPRSDSPSLAQGATTLNDYTLTSKQAYQNKTQTYQGDLGGKWHIDDQTTLTGEFVYNYSKIVDRNAILDTSFNAPSVTYDFDNNGTPNVAISGVDITDPSNFYIRTLFDNHSLATSKQYAYRADLQHDFEGGFLQNFKLGARYTNRKANSQATASIGQANPDPDGTQLTSIPGLASLSPGGLVDGKLGIDQFALSDTDFLLDNTDTIRQIFGYTGARAFDPTLAFFDKEKTYAAYAQVGYHLDAGSIPIDGIAGVRVVNTVEQLNGDGVNARENYLDWLPSATLRAKLTDKLQARLAYGKTITRPEFSALNPLVTYTPNGATGGDSYYGTGGGGNPMLTPIKSQAFDASLEYYFNRTSSVTVAGFYHKLKGYIQTYSAPEVYGVDGNGDPATYLVSRPRNTGDGKLYGAEAAYQQFFDFLPGALSGLGAQINGTFLIGTTADPNTGAQERLVNVSKYSYNAILIYEKYGISARLAYNWRSNFIDSYTSGGSQGGTIRVSPVQQLDFSGSYSPIPWLTLTFDATNLLDRTYHDRFVGVSQTTGLASNTPRDTRMYDRTFEFGARFKF
ncbi:TonB-dependent receptor [Sphingomonas abietis]|uniref:TonB-dependent receptor n=1 Tax=Sphingomonas abietis TaxID=3012344 RepID=A0ABY7NJ95_9SPHN|nr:TonB-dependent receptor [Sphingomonas abietis]WBO21563.1 TonB-dependent receptor [Sphingomonas abietis]